MVAMQHDIRLPRDYDMQIIRDRVATSGRAMGDYPGLGFKAFLITEALGSGAVNQYAPFYVWHDEKGLVDFLWGGKGFGNIVRDFGRPSTQTWVGSSFTAGRQLRPNPSHASKRLVHLSGHTDPHRVLPERPRWPPTWRRPPRPIP